MSTFSTGLVKVTETFAPMIERQLTGNGVHLDGYAKQCVISAISSINAALDAKNLKWDDPQLDKNNITQTLMNVAALRLNAAASPREVYFQIRNVNVKIDGKDNWKKQVEMGIEGDGNDAILNNFGRNVKQVRPYWLVREGDVFEYPTYNGLDLTPPKWSPRGQGEVVRIVYPIIFKDDSIQYFIGERDDVAKNLVAHVANQTMNHGFGIAEDRYKANAEQKKKIAAKRAEILGKAKGLGLGALDDPELQQYISPAWMEYHSREQMLIRKIRNNIVKKIPKDFGSAFVEMLHSEVTDETYASVRREIAENANSEPIDIKAEVKPEESASPVFQPAPDPVEENPIEEVGATDPQPTSFASEREKGSNIHQDVLDFEQQASAGPGF